MKRLLFLLFFGICVAHSSKAQVKIGANPQNIDAASVLELESTDKVLVITRVTTTQMNAIVPLQGAIVYNTDLQSVHFFDGTQWVNIGNDGGGPDGSLTADPIVNDVSTIVITPTANGDNLEVAQNSIGTLQIANGGVNGTDDILDNSIGPGKIQDQSVTQEKLSENSVGAFALDNDNIGVSAFNNDVGYITSANVVSTDAGNALQIGTDNGAFYDEAPLINAIQDNNDAIALDNDQSPSNEIQNITLIGSEIMLTNTATSIDIGPLIAAGATATVINSTPTVTVNGTGTTGDPFELTAVGGGPGTTEVADQITITGIGIVGDPFKIEPSATINQVLTTTAAGTEWADLPPSGGNALFDVSTISGTGVVGDEYTVADDAISTIKIQDANVTPIKIEPSATVNQVLTTTAVGTEWADLPPSGGSALFDLTTISGTGVAGDEYTVADDGITSAKIENATILAEDLNDMGATADGEILQWNTALGPSGGWEVSVNASHLGNNPNNIFFAGPGGVPFDTEDTPTDGDNGGLIWDPSKRFGSGSLYVGYKANGNSGGTSVLGDHSKLAVAERLPGTLAFPIQVVNEFSGAFETGTGILFAVSANGEPGGGGLVFERVGAQGQGDFHFLASAAGVTELPALSDKVLTVENDGDMILTGDIIGKNGAGTPGQVLTTTAAGTEWAAPSGGGTTITSADASINLTTTGSTVDLSVAEISGGASGNIAPNSITQGDIAPDAIGSSELDALSVGTSELKDGAVTAAKLNADVAGAGITQNIATGALEVDTSTLTGSGDVTGTGITVVGGTDAAFGNIALSISDDAVTPAKIQAGTNGQVLTTIGTAVTWEDPTDGLIVKGKNVTGVTGETTINIPNQPSTEYVINLTVRGVFNNRPYTIQVSDQQTNSFTVLVYELDPLGTGSYLPAANATFHYTVFEE